MAEIRFACERYDISDGLAMTLLDMIVYMIDLLPRRCSAWSRLVWIQAYRIDSQCRVTVALDMWVLSQKHTGSVTD